MSSILSTLSGSKGKSALLERTETDATTQQRTLPRRAFLTTRLDHHDRTLQLTNRALHDHCRSQWPLQSFCWGRLQRVNRTHLCGTDFSPGNGLFRVLPGRDSHTRVHGADHLCARAAIGQCRYSVRSRCQPYSPPLSGACPAVAI